MFILTLFGFIGGFLAGFLGLGGALFLSPLLFLSFQKVMDSCKGLFLHQALPLFFPLYPQFIVIVVLKTSPKRFIPPYSEQ
jgi:uncharacterized membrane protein YfcA